MDHLRVARKPTTFTATRGILTDNNNDNDDDNNNNNFILT
jgi:hypothetical protein